MAVLLVDVGNTQLKWCFQGGDQALNGTIPSAGLDTQALKAIKAEVGPLGAVGLSCVKSPEYERELASALAEVFELEPYVAAVERQACGVICSYEEPSRMGIDRWLAMVAVRSKVEGAFCVIDCGSAITIDWVDDSGQHLGGFILPGVRIALKALLGGTDQVIVDADQLDVASSSPGVSTTEAVYNGAWFSLVSQVTMAYQYLQSFSEGGVPTLTLTGGDAKLLSPKLNIPHEVDGGLVFEGLKLLMNTSGAG